MMQDIEDRLLRVDSRAVCDGVGERLRDALRGEPPYSPQIAQLVRRLEEQDWQRSVK